MTRVIQHFFWQEDLDHPEGGRENCAFVEFTEAETSAPSFGGHDSEFTNLEFGRMCVVDGSLEGKWYEPGEWETLYNESPELTYTELCESLEAFGSLPLDYVQECNTRAFICRNSKPMLALGAVPVGLAS